MHATYLALHLAHAGFGGSVGVRKVILHSWSGLSLRLDARWTRIVPKSVRKYIVLWACTFLSVTLVKLVLESGVLGEVWMSGWTLKALERLES